jgi:hypothetical protein
MRQGEYGANPVLWATATVVVGMVDVEHGLNLIVAGGDRGERGWECNVFGIGVYFDGPTGAEALDLSGSYPGGSRV